MNISIHQWSQVTLGAVVLCGLGTAALLGPLRETDVGHALRGEVNRAEATERCKDEVKQRVHAFGPTRFGTTARFDSSNHGS